MERTYPGTLPAIGQTILHYTILEKLGEGGMGVVYKAEDTKLRRVVSLKFLAPRIHSDEEERARFLDEARAVAALDHPNVCAIYEVGEAGGQPYLAMAYVQGETLARKIAAGRYQPSRCLITRLKSPKGSARLTKRGLFTATSRAPT